MPPMKSSEFGGEPKRFANDIEGPGSTSVFIASAVYIVCTECATFASVAPLSRKLELPDPSLTMTSIAMRDEVRGRSKWCGGPEDRLLVD